MDEIKETNDIYKRIYTVASVFLILIIQVYIILLTNGIDICDFQNVKPKSLSIILQVLVQLIGFGFVNVALYFSVNKIFEIFWLRKNKNKYFRGKWLHIHDKEKIRIGIVNIEQKFTDLDVSSFNVSPYDTDDSDVTNWEYVSSSLYPKYLIGIKFFGCYVAKKGNGEINYGVHLFDTIDMDSKGYPVKMRGIQSNTFSRDVNKIQNIKDKKGSIYLFKLINEELEEFLYQNDSLDLEENLRSLIFNEKFSDEPYVKQLKKVLQKNNS